MQILKAFAAEFKIATLKSGWSIARVYEETSRRWPIFHRGEAESAIAWVVTHPDALVRVLNEPARLREVLKTSCKMPGRASKLETPASLARKSG